MLSASPQLKLSPKPFYESDEAKLYSGTMHERKEAPKKDVILKKYQEDQDDDDDSNALDYYLSERFFGALFADEPRICTPIQVSDMRKERSFVYPKMSDGCLSDYLDATEAAAMKRGARDGTIHLLVNRLSLVRDTLVALRTMHERGIVHGDINPNNVFVHSPDQKSLKRGCLGDLAFAQPAGTYSRKVRGTDDYMPPETLLFECISAQEDVECFCNGWRMTPAMDMWAMGLVMWESLAGNFADILTERLQEDPYARSKDKPEDELESAICGQIHMRMAEHLEADSSSSSSGKKMEVVDLADWFVGEHVQGDPEATLLYTVSSYYRKELERIALKVVEWRDRREGTSAEAETNKGRRLYKYHDQLTDEFAVRKSSYVQVVFPQRQKKSDDIKCADINASLYEEAESFIRQCMQWRPERRLTAEQALNHPLFREVLPRLAALADIQLSPSIPSAPSLPNEVKEEEKEDLALIRELAINMSKDHVYYHQFLPLHVWIRVVEWAARAMHAKGQDPLERRSGLLLLVDIIFEMLFKHTPLERKQDTADSDDDALESVIKKRQREAYRAKQCDMIEEYMPVLTATYRPVQ